MNWYRIDYGYTMYDNYYKCYHHTGRHCFTKANNKDDARQNFEKYFEKYPLRDLKLHHIESVSYIPGMGII